MGLVDYNLPLGSVCKKSRAISSLQKIIAEVQADTLEMKKWGNGSLIIIILDSQGERK